MRLKPGPGILLLLGFLCLTSGAAAHTASEADLASAEKRYRSEGPAAALPEFEQLKEQFADQGNAVLEARAERFIGESHWRLGNFEEARPHLETAVERLRALGARLEEAKTLNVIGLLEWDIGDYDHAILNFELASDIALSFGDPRLAGATMNNKALVYDELGDYDRSLALYRQALDIYQDADFPRGKSDTLGNIGGVSLLLGRYPEALSHYREALAISEQLQTAAGMSLDHGNLALCYLGLGEIDTAIGHFDIALELARDAGLRKEEALWLRGKGNAMMEQGRFDLGLELQRDALAIYEAIGAYGPKLEALSDMGRLHLALGDLLSAEQYFQQALDDATRIGQQQVITANLLALGDIPYRHEHFGEAAGLYEQARSRAEQAGEQNYQMLSLLSLSRAHRGLGQFEVAAADAEQALALARSTESRRREAEAHYLQGEVARDLSRFAVSLDYFARARSVIGPEPDPGLLWQVHYGTALALIGLDRRREAVAELQAAAAQIESVRERLKEDRFKSGYLHDKYQVYIDLVRLQLELGRIQDAFFTAERLRARNFFDHLESSTLQAKRQGSPQQAYSLRERVRQLQKALAEEQEMPSHERRQRAIDVFSRELLLAERKYQAWLDDNRIGSSLNATADREGLLELQSKLHADEALVEYVVGQRHVMIFVLRADYLGAVVEPLDNLNLVAKINLVRDLIQDHTSEAWRAPAASLARTLIGSLLTRDLLADVQHLYVVPHGILNYLPFALLPTNGDVGSKVLMQQFTLTYLPAAEMLRHASEPAQADEGLLALAPANARLRHSLEEARNISALFAPNANLLTGSAATESAFKKQAGAYTVLHLSTHGYFNANNPMLSGLELEPDEMNDGQLEVHEILQLSLHAQLVTLSACETGLGSGWFNRLPAGDDFVSLTRAFLLAGSHSVLATLWEVDDRSTVTLMEGFYRGMEATADGTDAATSLALIQRELLNSTEFSHPYYWAPFVLVGQDIPPPSPAEIPRGQIL